ncbi:MAG: hypothetical protein WDA75_10440, partial [Candidatus Latescibacterota bacterium]
MSSTRPWIPAAGGPPPEPVWREPGQVKEPEFLASATLRYEAEGHEIVGRNRTCLNNRPLYCKDHGVVLAGDRPFLRLITDRGVAGVWAAALLRGGTGRWLHEWDQVESRYRCGRISWRVSDTNLTGVSVSLE